MRIFKVNEYCPNCNNLLNKKHICPKCKKHIPYESAIIIEEDEQNNGEYIEFDNLGELN